VDAVAAAGERVRPCGLLRPTSTGAVVIDVPPVNGKLRSQLRRGAHIGDRAWLRVGATPAELKATR
jgi:hypothetical protein